MTELPFEEIATLLDGYLWHEEKDGLFVPHRFEAWQEKHFEETVNYMNKPLKSVATASRRMTFVTDAEKLVIDGRFKRIAASVTVGQIDVLVDGFLTHHKEITTETELDTSFTFDLGAGEKCVTVYLPNIFALHLRRVAHNGSFARPVKSKRRILMTGDSITQGFTSVFPSLSYANILLRRLHADGLNQALGGAYFEASDIEKGISYTPDIITVSYGTNDWSRGQDIETRAREYLTTLRRLYPSQPVFVILPLWRGNVAEKKLAIMPFDRAHEIIRGVAEALGGFFVVDGRRLVPHDPAFFTADTTHPNDLGFTAYGNALADVIEKTLGLDPHR